MSLRSAVAFLVVLACALPAVAQDEGPDVRVLVGGLVGLMTDNDPKIEPAARIDVHWNVWRSDNTGSSRACDAHVLGDLTALPGDVVDVTDVASFRAIEFELGGSCRPFDSVGAAIYVGGGFTSRLPTRGLEARDEAPKYATFGALFQTPKRNAWLQVGLGPDQRLDGQYVLAVHVSGSLDLLVAPKNTRLEGTSLALVVSAILGLEHSPYAPSRRDVVRVGVFVGWGK